MTPPAPVSLPDPDSLLAVFRMKYGEPGHTGHGPARRRRYGYAVPDDVYDALIASLVTPGCRWLDVGGGRELFESNPVLSAELAARAGVLVGVDPSPNIHENPYAHRKVQAFIEEFTADKPFDLLTLRMVAEHITDPAAAVAAMARLTRPGGRVVVYTVNKFTPLAAAAWAVPFRFHHGIKRAVWRTEEKDTFPVAYRMNTRRDLRRVFAAHGFREALFAYLDDCRTFAQFRVMNHVELLVRSALRAVGLRYPENCLLGVYERV